MSVKKFSWYYVVIPLATFFVAALGSLITSDGMPWYATLTLPSWTPPGQAIGVAWTAIYILTALSAILVWQHFPRDRTLALITGVYVVNALLNILWSAVFFGQHNLARAVDVAMLLSLSVLVLIILISKHSRFAATLLVPYFLWASFASYLSYAVWQLNGG